MARYLFERDYKIILVEVSKKNLPLVRVLRSAGFSCSGALPGEESSDGDVEIYYLRCADSALRRGDVEGAT